MPTPRVGGLAQRGGRCQVQLNAGGVSACHVPGVKPLRSVSPNVRLDVSGDPSPVVSSLTQGRRGHIRGRAPHTHVSSTPSPRSRDPDGCIATQQTRTPRLRGERRLAQRLTVRAGSATQMHLTQSNGDGPARVARSSSVSPRTKRSPVRFPVRAGAWWVLTEVQ